MIHWEPENTNPLSDDAIHGAELLLNVTFPKDYFECLKRNYHAQPAECDYEINTPDGRMTGGFGMLLTIDPYSPDNLFSGLRAFPRGVIPITDDGGGNRICLDYREDQTRSNPRIVSYLHEVDPEINFFYLCDSFTDLLNSLYMPDDVREDRGISREDD